MGFGAVPAQAAPFAYVTNSADDSVSQYDIGAAGLLAPLSPPTVDTGTSPLGVAVNPDGQSVYVANADGNSVSQYSVGSGGGLSPKSPSTVAAGSRPGGVAVSPDGQNVYVANQNSASVSQYDLGGSGRLSPKSPAAVAAGNVPYGVAVSPDGQSVYVANGADNSVSQYDVGGSGALTPKSPATVAAGSFPYAVAVSPDGQSVYVTNFAGHDVSQYDVGGDGRLSPKSPATVAAGTLPYGVAVSPDGQSVYVANAAANSVSQYDVGGDGRLSPKSPAAVAAGSGPSGVAVSPDGESVYVTNADGNNVSQFDVGSGGALSPKSPAAVAAGSRPEGVAVSPAMAHERPANVLVIETDDQTLESVRVMDNVNSLIGDQGTTFERSFVNYSLCCPSRATFLTGQYAHNHGVLANTAPEGGFSRFQALHGDNNLAVWLQDSGYHTALIGKYLNGYSNSPRVPPGWSEWYAAAPDDQAVYNYTLNENGTLVKYGQAPRDFKQDVLTRKAVAFVDRRASSAQPFFLWLTYTAPHFSGPKNPNPPGNCGGAAKPAPRHAHAFDSEPLPMPPSFNEADVSDKPAEIRNRPRLTASKVTDIQRKYRCELESLLSVDEGVKKIVQALSAKGELDDTLIAFTSDNGYLHGEHRLPQGKERIYEESIRVPLQMRGPGIPQGVNLGDLSINADLAPTIVDVADANPGLVMDGLSLIPVAQNPGIEQGRELLIEAERGLNQQPPFKAIRTERYVYAEHDTGEQELYDLQKDPFELRSRHNAAAYASVKAQLAAQLHELQNCAGSSCRLHSEP